jgi:orotidine-5'-phosphate decarboxylase
MDRDQAAARLLCAVDTTDLDQAARLAERLAGRVGGIKLGLEFFCAHGPSGVRRVLQRGQGLFLDLKLHDIPNTVAGGIKGAAAMQPFLTTIHASGGPAMMRAAMEAARSLGENRPRVVAVTMLTSMDDADLTAVGMAPPVGEQVVRLAALAQGCGVDGVVCSPHEAERLRRECGDDFLLVVPGVRPSWAASDDQKRIMTPREAVSAGASYLVVGRPITRADDPAEAADRIVADMVG